MRSPFGKIAGIRTVQNEPLSRHTSLRIGGNARFFIRVYSRRALLRVLHIIKKKRMKYFVIGAGSNLLVTDRGFPGVVLRLDGIFKRVESRGNIFSCGGGSLIETFLKKTGTLGYGGAEFLVGIPGTIGGGIRGNAGAFGKSFADITERVTIVDKGIREEDKDCGEIGFGYRSSKLKNGEIIISANIRLRKKRRKDIVALMRTNLRHRLERQPLGYSAGSFFKNPPCCPAGELIEACCLKGLRIGAAEVSMKHGNYIINRGGAHASDVLRLVSIIKKTVKKKTGVSLETEVRILK
jgi:UDP-N-acetylmuramate dehydrogenase